MLLHYLHVQVEVSLMACGVNLKYWKSITWWHNFDRLIMYIPHMVFLWKVRYGFSYHQSWYVLILVVCFPDTKHNLCLQLTSCFPRQTAFLFKGRLRFSESCYFLGEWGESYLMELASTCNDRKIVSNLQLSDNISLK